MPNLNFSPPAVPATAYAASWANKWTDPENGLLTEEDLELLAHVNCSYLSSSRPPTLLALKQHAQSLVVLIQRLSVSGTNGVVVGESGAAASETGEQFLRHDAFDWLNDLSTPYTNDDEGHHLPIRALMNTVTQESECGGAETHCPLKTVQMQTQQDKRDGGSPERPFASHQNLVMHANACLELLDHEYSSTGGLMSILPSAYESDSGQLEAARNTLLGQWLLHQQDLVARLHELEISYTNALAVAEGVAVAPLHADTSTGTSDGGGEGVLHGAAAPQDELVIVGHRTHTYERIHALLDRAEAHVEKKQKLWWERGVSGEREWMESRGGEWYARGLVPLDLETRFFRFKGQGRRGKLFMMPGITQSAALAHLVAMEARPTVVSVVTPKWAERATALESRLRKNLNGDDEEEAPGAFGSGV